MSKHDKQNKEIKEINLELASPIDSADFSFVNNSLSSHRSSDSGCSSSSHHSSGKCGPCNLCEFIKADPSDIEKNGGRLLTVKIQVNHVCYNKKVYVACIIYGVCDKILVFKGFTTTLRKDTGSDKKACGTIERKLVFAVPDDDIFDPDKLDVRIIANYIYPCE